MINHNPSSWLLNLGNEWYEGECCQCGTDLLLAPGDVVSVIVGKGQNIDAILCTCCSKGIHIRGGG